MYFLSIANYHLSSSSGLAQVFTQGESKNPKERVEVCKAPWCLFKKLSHCHFCHVLLATTFTISTQIQGSRILLVLSFSLFLSPLFLFVCVSWITLLKLLGVKSLILPALLFYCCQIWCRKQYKFIILLFYRSEIYYSTQWANKGVGRAAFHSERFRGGCFLVLLDCWQNSVPCGCRTEIPVFSWTVWWWIAVHHLWRLHTFLVSWMLSSIFIKPSMASQVPPTSHLTQPILCFNGSMRLDALRWRYFSKSAPLQDS